MKTLVGAFKQEKALVGAFSVIVQPVVEPMEHYTALLMYLDIIYLSAPDLPGEAAHGVWHAGPVDVAHPAAGAPHHAAPAHPHLEGELVLQHGHL